MRKPKFKGKGRGDEGFRRKVGGACGEGDQYGPSSKSLADVEK